MNKYVLLQGIVMPLLSQISNTSTIYANAVTATVPGFNDIRSKVNEILVNGYGYTNLMSVNVVAGELINSKQWNDVVTDFQKIYVHLNDTLALFTTIPATNDLITETFVEHTIDYTWLSNQDATYFFNLGGRISFALTSSNGTGSTSTYWANLISTANSALGATSYDHSSYSTSKILYNNGTIVVSVNKISGTQFRANVKLDPLLDEAFNKIYTVDNKFLMVRIIIASAIEAFYYYIKIIYLKQKRPSFDGLSELRINSYYSITIDLTSFTFSPATCTKYFPF